MQDKGGLETGGVEDLPSFSRLHKNKARFIPCMLALRARSWDSIERIRCAQRQINGVDPMFWGSTQVHFFMPSRSSPYGLT